MGINKVQAFNLETPKQSFSLINTGDYIIEYSGGNQQVRKTTLPYLIFDNLKPYLYIFNENTTPEKPNIKREDVIKIKKKIQANTNVSVPVSPKDILNSTKGMVTSVDSDARRTFFELIDVATDEFSDGGKDITPDEQIEILDQFLKWYNNKDLPWSKAKKIDIKSLIIKD